MPNVRWLLALITSVHRFVYRASGGRLGGRMMGMRVLLLKHVGRKTDLERVTPLLYIRDGEHWVVVASNAGDDRSPAWWLNLMRNPEVEIQVERERFAVKARRASDTEAERLWPELVRAYRYYDDYRERTAREIPVAILERVA